MSTHRRDIQYELTSNCDADVIYDSHVKTRLDDDVIISSRDALPHKVDTFNPWNVTSTGNPRATQWKSLKCREKVTRSMWVIIRLLLAVLLLFLFVCSLHLMQPAFQLLGGRRAGNVLTHSVLINNPVSALMLGVIVTVFIQSSSASTSIVVTLVAAGMLTVKQSIPIVMGANIGTSVTNTLVSMAQSGHRDVFRRAFAGATVHDMFNWLTVLILLPLEVVSNYLLLLTGWLVKSVGATGRDTPQFLLAVILPIAHQIIEIDRSILDAVNHGTDRQSFPLPRYFCTEVVRNHTILFEDGVNQTFVEQIKDRQFSFDIQISATEINQTIMTWLEVDPDKSSLCHHLYTGCGTEGGLSETAGGLILITLSLGLVIICLILLVKTLNSLLKGHIAGVIHKSINAELPGKAQFITGYLRILLGGVITFFIQSSSLFTCTLTPLVGLGVVTLETMYPLTLGANLGTTFTSILAALTADPESLAKALQISLCHLFFNISGILLFYPVPVLRRVPLRLAVGMGNTTAKYRWFALAYLLGVFLFIPALVFAFSLAGPHIFLAVFIPIVIVIVVILVINAMRRKCPGKLPAKFRSWKCLPRPLRSLQPYDSCLGRCCCRLGFCRRILSQDKYHNADEREDFSDILYIVPDDLLHTFSYSELVESLDIGVEALEQIE